MRKEENYKWALKQIRAQIKRHIDLTATLANTAAILKERFPQFFWVGFYILRKDQLILGPFQGPPACMSLNLGKGVCAAAVKLNKIINVPNVNEFPGHVACDSRSQSEIVVPLLNKKAMIAAVLDIDSDSLESFDNIDIKWLKEIARLLKDIF